MLDFLHPQYVGVFGQRRSRTKLKKVLKCDGALGDLTCMKYNSTGCKTLVVIQVTGKNWFMALSVAMCSLGPQTLPDYDWRVALPSKTCLFSPTQNFQKISGKLRPMVARCCRPSWKGCRATPPVRIPQIPAEPPLFAAGAPGRNASDDIGVQPPLHPLVKIKIAGISGSSKLIAGIQDGGGPAISWFINHHNPYYITSSLYLP